MNLDNVQESSPCAYSSACKLASNHCTYKNFVTIIISLQCLSIELYNTITTRGTHAFLV